jgi:hypothetical protein
MNAWLLQCAPTTNSGARRSNCRPRGPRHVTRSSVAPCRNCTSVRLRAVVDGDMENDRPLGDVLIVKASS